MHRFDIPTDPVALGGKRLPAYRTDLGAAYRGDSMELVPLLPDGCLDLVMTSPPFALQRAKEYGNGDQADYVRWLSGFVRAVIPKLRDTGSIVIDIGGAYESGRPTRSLYPFRVLVALCDDLGLHLAQDWYWNNRAKLPSPIEWVCKRKVRAKDSVNTVWHLSKTPWPKADVTRVLTPYSGSMLKLMAAASVKEAKQQVRPSGHVIGTRFAKDNGGALPSNLLDFPNTESNGRYHDGCRLVSGKAHPARFPRALPDFFVRMLTDPGDLVLDIFAGSNTTGEAAECLGRRWVSFEQRADYLACSAFRFLPRDVGEDRIRKVHAAVLDGWTVDLTRAGIAARGLEAFPPACSPGASESAGAA